MPVSVLCSRLTFFVTILCVAAPAGAQEADSLRRDASGMIAPLWTIGSPAEDRARVRQILGAAPTDGYLLRSPSSLTAPLPDPSNSFRWSLITPELSMVYNSGLPFSLNQGSMWAGRGLNTRVRAGFRTSYGPVDLILAPELVRMENRSVAIIWSRDPDRSAFSLPWYHGDVSVDLPVRFGVDPLTVVSPGQSSLSVRLGTVTAGAATENHWWGPGIRNAILLSNNAPGFPHLFLRTTSPINTRAGTFAAKWIVGGLTESLFFDTISSNDIRSLSAAAITYQPAGAPNLTLGIARSVYSEVDDGSSVPGQAFDVFTWWGRPSLALADSIDTSSEQILSLFGRWIFPRDGLEVYAEWARTELPRSLRDFLTAPHHTQGYTLGLQWARPLMDSTGIFRLQTELTYLEQSSTFRIRPTPGYYVSRTVPQGYTHRGRTIGAAIGPGASSQWIAADYMAARWSVGLFAGRIRWDNDAYYRQPTGISYIAHDVSVFTGIRGRARLGWVDITARLKRGKRYNYLYKNLLRGFGDDGADDRRNITFELTVTPLLGDRREFVPISPKVP